MSTRVRAKLSKGSGLDVSDTLAGEHHTLPYLLKGPGAPVLKAETEFEDLSLKLPELLKQKLHLLLRVLMRQLRIRRLGKHGFAQLLETRLRTEVAL